MESVVVVGAVTTYAFMEGLTMLAESYKRRRFEEGKEEGRRAVVDEIRNAPPDKRLEVIDRIIAETQEIVQRGDRNRAVLKRLSPETRERVERELYGSQD